MSAVKNPSTDPNDPEYDAEYEEDLEYQCSGTDQSAAISPTICTIGHCGVYVLWSKNSLLTTPRALSADPDPEGDESDDEDYPEGAEPAGDDEEDAK